MIPSQSQQDYSVCYNLPTELTYIYYQSSQIQK